MEGDCSAPGLGLSITDRQTLITNVNIMFHAAATVRFDEDLKLAFTINVNGTRDVLELAKEMKNLKVREKYLFTKEVMKTLVKGAVRRYCYSYVAVFECNQVEWLVKIRRITGSWMLSKSFRLTASIRAIGCLLSVNL